MYPEVLNLTGVVHPRGDEIYTYTINPHFFPVKGILARFVGDCLANCEIPGRGTKPENSDGMRVTEWYRAGSEVGLGGVTSVTWNTFWRLRKMASRLEKPLEGPREAAPANLRLVSPFVFQGLVDDE
jgi:hypothetical protein